MEASLARIQGRIVIAGGSGLIGSALARALAQTGSEVVVLTRRSDAGAPQGDSTSTSVSWDARTLGPWADTLDGALAVVNLVGRTVDCVKTPDHRDEILRSRVEATRVLGEAARSVRTPPAVWVQMSTAHIYGDPPRRVCTEESPLGLGLAPDVGRAWEAAYADAKPGGTRGVVLRTGFVLARGGGAYPRLRLLARAGLGGTVGSGTQGMSWLHADDMAAILVRAIGDDSMAGVYIASGPNPVSNREFMRALRRSIGAPFGLPAPAPLVRIGAPLLMRTDPELALYGRYCVPKRLLDVGFEFAYPEIDAALRDLCTADHQSASR